MYMLFRYDTGVLCYLRGFPLRWFYFYDMAGESGKNGKGIIYHYYKCGGAKRKLGCKRKAVKKDWIEEVVVRITVSKVLTDEAIDRIADAILEIQNEGDTLTPTLHQQLRECETSSTKERLEELEKQWEALKLSLLQAQMERPKYSKEYIVSWISRFKYGNIHDKAYRKEIIDIFVNSVYLYDDHLVFTYNFKDGTQTLTLQEIESALCSDLASSASPEKKTPFVYQTNGVFFSTK